MQQGLEKIVLVFFFVPSRWRRGRKCFDVLSAKYLRAEEGSHCKARIHPGVEVAHANVHGTVKVERRQLAKLTAVGFDGKLDR